MATHIDYTTTTIGGTLLAEAAAQLVDVRLKFRRLKQLADAVSSGGGQPVLLESDPTFALPSGTGSNVYTHIADLSATLESMTQLADLDMGG